MVVGGLPQPKGMIEEPLPPVSCFQHILLHRDLSSTAAGYVLLTCTSIFVSVDDAIPLQARPHIDLIDVAVVVDVHG